MADILVQQNRIDAAIDHLQEALRIDPDYRPAQELLDDLRKKRPQKP
jgi:hypothetical protein